MADREREFDPESGQVFGGPTDNSETPLEIREALNDIQRKVNGIASSAEDLIAMAHDFGASDDPIVRRNLAAALIQLDTVKEELSGFFGIDIDTIVSSIDQGEEPGFGIEGEEGVSPPEGEEEEPEIDLGDEGEFEAAGLEEPGEREGEEGLLVPTRPRGSEVRLGGGPRRGESLEAGFRADAEKLIEARKLDPRLRQIMQWAQRVAQRVSRAITRARSSRRKGRRRESLQTAPRRQPTRRMRESKAATPPRIYLARRSDGTCRAVPVPRGVTIREALERKRVITESLPSTVKTLVEGRFPYHDAILALESEGWQILYRDDNRTIVTHSTLY